MVTMTLQDKKKRISVVVSDQATAKEKELAEWLVCEMEFAADELENEQSVEDEGKPKTPLPEEEVSSCEDPFEGEFFPDFESKEERAGEETRMRIFFTGLVTGWFVIGFGILLALAGRKVFGWLAETLAIPPDALIGLGLTFLLAMLFRRKIKQAAARLTHWFYSK